MVRYLSATGRCRYPNRNGVCCSLDGMLQVDVWSRSRKGNSGGWTRSTERKAVSVWHRSYDCKDAVLCGARVRKNQASSVDCSGGWYVGTVFHKQYQPRSECRSGEVDT